MMFTRRRLAVLAVVAALILLVMGCGPKPPCPVGPSVVKKAQDETSAVQTSIAEVEGEREQLEEQLRQKEARLEELKGKPEMLKKKLDGLKKGSGR